MILPIPAAILRRQMINVFELLLAEDCSHLLVNGNIRPEMPGIFPLKDVTGENLMASGTEFICEIGANKPPSSGDQDICHRLSSSLFKLLGLFFVQN
jgi:hypothetical protein